MPFATRKKSCLRKPAPRNGELTLMLRRPCSNVELRTPRPTSMRRLPKVRGPEGLNSIIASYQLFSSARDSSFSPQSTNNLATSSCKLAPAKPARARRALCQARLVPAEGWRVFRRSREWSHRAIPDLAHGSRIFRALRAVLPGGFSPCTILLYRGENPPGRTANPILISRTVYLPRFTSVCK